MKKITIAIIKLYQKYLSPIKGRKCPYLPTCSNYGLEAVEKYGAVRGGLMAFWRILRCNPFSKGGYDPVPDELKKNSMVKMRFTSKKNRNEDNNLI